MCVRVDNRVKEVCIGKKRKKGASPGIEPGPLAPEANIIPLNYEAVRGKCQEVSDKSREEEVWRGKERRREKRGGVTV